MAYSGHIFISYSKQDIDFVRYLRAMLESEGFWVWMDEARLHPGDEWWDSIVQNIEQASAVIVVMSPNSLDSKWAQREILYAEKVNRPIFPVLLAGDNWSRLADIQFEDMRDGLRAKLSRRFIASLGGVQAAKSATREIAFSIETDDIMTFPSDVVALKYARGFHGADHIAAMMLISKGVDVELMEPPMDEYRYFETQGALVAPHVLFVGTPRLRHMGYQHIREFGTRALAAVAESEPSTRHLAMTLHGPGFGRDETEAMISQFGGLTDAIEAKSLPRGLERITIVEFNEDRAARLRVVMEGLLDSASFARRMEDTEWGYWLTVGVKEDQSTNETSEERHVSETLATAGKRARTHAYVAINVTPETDDFYYYGIQNPIHALGLLCERSGEEGNNLPVLNGDQGEDDIHSRIKARIDGAAVVIAEVSSPDPEIYLQLGYAWGCGCPVILIARSHVDLSTTPLATSPCLRYDKIRNLEQGLSAALTTLRDRWNGR